MQPDDPVVDSACAAPGAVNVGAKVDAFVAAARALSAVTPGNDVMMTMGSDFQYAAAAVAFKNLDKLVHHVNADGRVNAFYSTPAAYVSAKHAYGAAWPLKTDDFFPYADCPSCYWTGYFASRPSLKVHVRKSGSLLAAARQLAVLDGVLRDGVGKGGGDAGLAALGDAAAGTAEVRTAAGAGGIPACLGRGGPAAAPQAGLEAVPAAAPLAGLEAGPVAAPQAGLKAGPAAVSRAGLARLGDRPSPSSWETALDALEEATALGQHHDAVTGTSKQHVACDYARRLAAGRVGVEPLVGGALERMALQTTSSAGVAWCPALNASVCGPSARASAAGGRFAVLVYNPLAQARREGVKIPISIGRTDEWGVTGPGGDDVDAQVAPLAAGARAAAASLVAAGGAEPGEAPTHELMFVVDLPPLGGAAYVVGPVRDGRRAAERPPLVAGVGALQPAAAPSSPPSPSGATLTAASIESTTTTTLHSRGLSLDLGVGLAWFNASDGSPPPGGKDRGSASGAYIFRPHARIPFKRPKAATLAGNVAQELRLEYAPWASVVVRTWAGLADADVEWHAGPLPVGDGLGKEVVVEYSTALATRGRLATDSNGRRMLVRRRNARPTWRLNVTEPVAGNFYPITSAASIQQEDGLALAVVTDRAQGAASLADGSVSVMVHRRLLRDDARGVDEFLNETECGCTHCGCGGLVAVGRHSLVLAAAGDDVAAARRAAQARAAHPLILALLPEDEGKGVRLEASPPPASSACPAGLPANVHLLTLAPHSDGRVLLRLAHTFEMGEHAELGQEVTVDLNAVIAGMTWEAVEELALTAVRPLADVTRRRWRVSGPLGGEDGAVGGVGVGGGNDAPPEPPTTSSSSASHHQPAPFRCTTRCADGPLRVALAPMQVRTFALMPTGRRAGGGTATTA